MNGDGIGPGITAEAEKNPSSLGQAGSARWGERA
jgi:hypothetical protein